MTASNIHFLHQNIIKSIPINSKGRDFIIGDLHGCIDELNKLMNYVSFDFQKDRLFSTGDLIDRGPNSLACLQLLKNDWFYSVLGNHEELLINKIKLLQQNQTQSFNDNEISFLIEAMSFLPYLERLPFILEIQNKVFNEIFIVHAEILPEHLLDLNLESVNSDQYEKMFQTMKNEDMSDIILKFIDGMKKMIDQKNIDIDNLSDNNQETIIKQNHKQKLIWSRKIVSSFYKDNMQFIDNGDFSFLKKKSFSQKSKIFCGHNVVPFPVKIGQQYYLDTGAALGYNSHDLSSNLFTQFGHEFFALSMVDLTSGFCYGCISSQNMRGKIVKLEKPIYHYEELTS